jgi:hypothetical protein
MDVGLMVVVMVVYSALLKSYKALTGQHLQPPYYDAVVWLIENSLNYEMGHSKSTAKF